MGVSNITLGEMRDTVAKMLEMIAKQCPPDQLFALTYRTEDDKVTHIILEERA